MTKTDAIAKGILASGYKEVPGNSRKYRTFHNPAARFAYLVLGKSAALRGSSANRSSDSLSLSDRTKKTFMETGSLL